jgi:hypothetical protein
MSQTQTRKQKILGDVKRKRRQRTITTIVIAIGLIAIVVLAVVFLRGPPNPVSLPDYLSHCITGGLFYHSHPNLTIIINRVGVPMPGPTFNSGCGQPLHTHDSSGVIHVETDQDRDYTLHDWFLLWGFYVANNNYTIFNSNQIFTYKVDATHHLTMTVNGINDTSFENHRFPRNASPTGGVSVAPPASNLCGASPVGASCVKDNIVISYG